VNRRSQESELRSQKNGTRLQRQIALAALVAVTALQCGAMAAPPEQFGVWGTAGPELPPPEGWTEAAAPPEALPALMPTAEEQAKGYVLFAREPFTPIPPNCVPAPSERTTELKTFCARGEYEPLSLGIYALSNLRGLQVKVSSLTAPGDAVIPADHIDVRVVRCVRETVNGGAKTYRLRPFLLEKRPTFDLAAGRTAQAWLTIQAPGDAAAGTYAGTVTVSPEQGTPTALRVQLRVLPFTLPSAPIELSMCFPRPPDDDGLLRKQLIDLREHGMTGVEAGPGAFVESRDRRFGDDDIAATIARSRRLMAAFKGAYSQWRFPVTFEVGHQIAYYWDPGKNWFVLWPHDPTIEADFFRAIEVVEKLAGEDGWPPLRAYALDEAGAHGLLDEAVYYYGLIKQRKPELTTWTTIGGGIAMGHDEIGQLSPVVDFLSTNRFTPEIAKALADRGKPFGVYNGAGDTPAGARFFFGFYGWKTAAQQVLQWAYSFGESALQGNGLRQPDEGYIYNAPDGPLPSLQWEAAREGVDDYRYVELLRQWAGASAPVYLGEIMSQIPWTFQSIASGDRTPPPHPSTLRKWRERIAERIVGLSLRGAPAADAALRSPFDFPWAQPAAEKVVYGEELCPTATFETETKPWRIEAWNGKGVGELDPAVAHEGQQSVRIDSPADAGNEAVTVLVWPQWGGGGLNLGLAGDHVYETAAWVKLQGRNTLPELRIALPAEAERSVLTGREDGPDGWQRIWKRVEVAFPVRPTYVAAWVQGPGTVWIDELSLREVIPTPVRVALDQAEYDGLDRVAVATVTVSKQLAPANLSVMVAPEGGAPVSQVTVPFRVQAAIGADAAAGALTLMAPGNLHDCRVVFDPSALKPGAYRLSVELQDAAEAILGQAEAPFRRTGEG